MPPGLLALRARNDAPDARLRALRARPGAASARLGALRASLGPCTQGFLLRAQDREPRIQGARPDARDAACVARASEALPGRCKGRDAPDFGPAGARDAAP